MTSLTWSHDLSLNMFYPFSAFIKGIVDTKQTTLQGLVYLKCPYLNKVSTLSMYDPLVET